MALSSTTLNALLFMFIGLIFASKLAPRQTCSTGYTLCAPPGATGSDTYDVGDNLLHLYSNLLDTVDPQAPAPGASPPSANPNGPAKRESAETMCCASGLSCMLLSVAEVPMCYDKFTTDYALPNGDFGTISNGTLITASGVRVNLITGTFSVPNGQTGNIYSSASFDKPNTTTLSIPTQYTSSGVGSAIPASQLGSSAGQTTSPAVTGTVNSILSSSASPSRLSLNGPAVTPCSACCNECGRPSTTTNATTPMATSTFPDSSSLPSYVTGTGNAAITPPITIGRGTLVQIPRLSQLSLIVILAGVLTFVATD